MNNKRTAEMLEEMRRLPWRKDVINSLNKQLKERGKLTDKQQSFITDMYLDNCVISDEEIKKQIELRKLCLRLIKCNLGKIHGFVSSVIQFTESRPFSSAQSNSIMKIAQRKRKELKTISEYTKETFDGWKEK